MFLFDEFKKLLQFHSKILVIIILLSVSSVNARTFSNAYISFRIPDSWSCAPDQSEWICRSIRNPSAKEAVVVLAAKEVGVTDRYELYEGHLNNPIPNLLGAGGGQSKVIYKAKSVLINNQKWLDGLHFQSEVPNYYTRYLAAIKEARIAVVVTFSAHKEVYAKYSQEFFNIVNSLKITASGASKIIQPPGLNWGPSIGGPLYPSDSKFDEPAKPSQGKTKNKNLLLGIGLIIIAALGFVLLRSNKKS